ncbi:MAG TPA: MarR family transcriptional regulator [Propionibacteriaceae bacterium]|nr:MarR family transcriptional regulator [Propionibacteriaceae bacterium]
MARPDTDSLEGAPLADLVLRLSRTLRIEFAHACEPLGLNPHQVRALYVIAGSDGARLNVLAERLRVAPRSATDVVDALEAKGLVERTPDPDDRRATLVRLTPEGATLHEQAHRIRESVHEQAFSVLSSAEQAELRRLLTTSLG